MPATFSVIYRRTSRPHRAVLLALAGVFEVGKAHRADAWLGSGGEGEFQHSEGLFGVSPGSVRNVSAGFARDAALKTGSDDRMGERPKDAAYTIISQTPGRGCVFSTL
jgi:hypothetical protein